MKTSDKKERVTSFDFIRCFATFCILIFHFLINSNGKHIYPDSLFFFNYDVAQVGVSLFFILSGAALYYNDNKKKNLKDYYKNRFLAIFPMFYVAYIMIFLISFWNEGNIPVGIPIQNLLLTLIGMDGFLSYKIPCFPMVGEWFLGCIIILYIVYPLIKYFIKKKPIIAFSIMTTFYVILCLNYNFEMWMIFNPLVRFLEFSFGVLYIELYNRGKIGNIKKFSLITFIISAVFTAAMLYAPIPIHQMFLITLGGCSLFTMMMELGKLIKNKFLINILKLGSKYSFAIFLVHHYIANYVRYHFINNLRLFECILAFAIYIILVLIAAKIVFEITNRIINFVKNFKLNYK